MAYYRCSSENTAKLGSGLISDVNENWLTTNLDDSILNYDAIIIHLHGTRAGLTQNLISIIPKQYYSTVTSSIYVPEYIQEMEGTFGNSDMEVKIYSDKIEGLHYSGDWFDCYCEVFGLKSINLAS